jgi:hypothetical protein
MGIADGHGLLLALRIISVSLAEVKLVELTLQERIVPDKAYGSERLDEKLMRKYGTELIAPNKINRCVTTQNGRSLRRYHKRWKIGRLFAWLFNLRRLAMRYKHNADYFQGFLHPTVTVILLRHLPVSCGQRLILPCASFTPL